MRLNAVISHRSGSHFFWSRCCSVPTKKCRHARDPKIRVILRNPRKSAIQTRKIRAFRFLVDITGHSCYTIDSKRVTK